VGLVVVAGADTIGWEEDSEVIGSAVVARDGDRLVITSLKADRPDVAESLLRALAEGASADEIVGADGDAAAYRACGFGKQNDGTWRLVLDASPDSEAAPTFTLTELESAVRQAWSAETADNPDAWSPENPAKEHCDVTALVVRDLLGGEILVANVIRDGRRVERHAWNRLDSGVELDLTRSQFRDGEQLGPAEPSEPLAFRRTPERYELFGARVRAALGL
jgi:hypothetical protein